MKKIKFKAERFKHGYILFVKTSFFGKWKNCSTGYYYEVNSSKHFCNNESERHNILFITKNKIIIYPNIIFLLKRLRELNDYGFFVQKKNKFFFYNSGY